MKLTIEGEQLKQAVGFARRAAEKKATSMPILECAMIEANGDTLTVLCTDLETFARKRVDAQVEKKGAACVPVAILAGIADALADETIEMEVVKNVFYARSRAAEYKIPTARADDYPDWPKVEPRATIEMRSEDFLVGARAALWGAAVKDPRRVLVGVLLDLRSGPEVRLVGCNGLALGMGICEPEEIVGEQVVERILTRIFVETVAVMAGAEPVRIEIGEQFSRCEIGGAAVVCPLINGTYPRYETVVPTKFKTKTKIEINPWLKLAGRAAPMVDTQYRSLFLSLSEGRLKMASRSFSAGEFRDEIACAWTKKPLEIAFNSSLLVPLLKEISGRFATAQLNVVDGESPVTVTVDDERLLYLVMPLAIGEGVAPGEEEPKEVPEEPEATE